MSAAVAIPRVSVLMPVRNGLPWLTAAVASILSQTFRPFELIVLEDGSTDATAAYLASLDDPRIRVVATGGVGIARALDVGLRISRGTYIACHDAHDESLPDRFAAQAALLDERLDIDVVATVADYMDDQGLPIGDDRVIPLRGTTHGSVMARASALRGAAGHRGRMVSADDDNSRLRLLPADRFAKIAKPLYRRRMHGTWPGVHTAETAHAIIVQHSVGGAMTSPLS